jgi:hypothetical protein
MSRDPFDQELHQLAEILARWVDHVTCVPAVYLFGSRVRGDHRPDSDVDVRLFLDNWKPNRESMLWWDEQNNTDFAELRGQLPGSLTLHREPRNDADQQILTGKHVLVVRKAICVWTPTQA